MYKQASKEKLRFNTSKGTLSVEQMWDLPMVTLATITRNLKKELKDENDDDLSFLDSKSKPTDPLLELRFNIVKDIYLTKKAEKEMENNAAEVKLHNQKILSIIKKKQDEHLEKLSAEELEKLLK